MTDDEDTRIKLIMLGIERVETRLYALHNRVTELTGANGRPSMHERLAGQSITIGDYQTQVSKLRDEIERLKSRPAEDPHVSGGLWEAVHRLSARVKTLEDKPTATYVESPKPPFPPDLIELVRAARNAKAEIGSMPWNEARQSIFRRLSDALSKFAGII